MATEIVFMVWEDGKERPSTSTSFARDNFTERGRTSAFKRGRVFASSTWRTSLCD